MAPSMFSAPKLLIVLGLLFLLVILPSLAGLALVIARIRDGKDGRG
jgi:hypothetical protein